MKISASIYSNKSKTIPEIVNELDSYHVDYFHVDCKNDLTVFDDIKTIRKISRVPIDLHVITEEPEKFYPLIDECAIENFCFQHEDLEKMLDIPSNIKFKSKIGIAIGKNTNVSVFNKYFKKGFDFGLLMTTIPGESGGKFDESTYDRVKEFKASFPSKRLFVDGGVNNNVASHLRSLGVDCSISGSYLVKSAKMGVALMRLKSDLEELSFPVSDYMLKQAELPILNLSDISLKSVIETISTFKLGHCLIVNENNELKGVISDGDLRKELLNNITNLSEVSVNNMINENPLVITEDKLVSDAIENISNHYKKITFLPVVDSSNRIKGSISVNQLIQGKL